MKIKTFLHFLVNYNFIEPQRFFKKLGEEGGGPETKFSGVCNMMYN